MKTLVLIFASLISLNAAADAFSSPGVWEQLQLRGERTVKAKIESIEVAGNYTWIEFKEDGQPAQKTRLCQNERNEPFPDFYSEPVRAVHYSERFGLLRQALKSQETVELGFQGPWSPCLTSVKAVKPGKLANND